MPYLHPYKLFISHAWAYEEAYTGIIQFLNDASNFSYSNFSVPKDKAFDSMTKSQLQQQLRNQINPIQCAIILGGMYIAHSDWIQFEIDHAVKLDKPILGIRPWGAERMPQALINAATEVVGWNTASIVAAIRRLVP